MSVSICCFNLESKIKNVLFKYGFYESDHLINLSPQQLSHVTHLSIDDCTTILQQIKEDNTEFKISNAFFLFQNDQKKKSILTFSKQLNSIVEDGFPLEMLIEIFGTAGVGKTQICLQLCINVQLPEELGGLSSEALFIDTENSFRTLRFQEMATNAIHLINKKEQQFSIKSFMDGCHLFQCKELTQLQTIILHQLESFLDTHPKVRLLIVDSIAYFFKYEFLSNVKQRNQILWSLMRKLKCFALNRNICVVLTNHVHYNPDTDQTLSALGKAWEHHCSIRLFLEKDLESNIRSATLIKSSFKPNQKIYFSITPQGVLDSFEEIKNKN